MSNQTVNIKLSNLATGYRNHKATTVITSGINATIHAGEFTCLLGPNGAGKSTLLRTLCGFQPPLLGDITINGKPLTSISPEQLARQIGVVLTERLNISNMTVGQLVALGRAPYTGFWGHLNPSDHEAVNHAIDLTGIAPLRDRMIQTLSDGERQKTMIAKALAQQTPAIFLDEPTAFLDYPSKVEIMRLLHRLAHDDGKTIFLSTHDLELALQIADSLWLIHPEHGFTTGLPEDLAFNRSIERYFERKGVEFDPAACAFRMSALINRQIPVYGNQSVLRSLVEKALMRSGIQPINVLSAEEITPETIVVAGNEIALGEKKYPDIAALLSAIR